MRKFNQTWPVIMIEVKPHERSCRTDFTEHVSGVFAEPLLLIERFSVLRLNYSKIGIVSEIHVRPKCEKD